MERVIRYVHSAGESLDLIFRGMLAFPVKSSKAQTSLKDRHAKSDPNVIAWRHDDDDVEYRLAFTKEQREQIEQAFTKASPEQVTPWGIKQVTDNAAIFVGLLEAWANSAPLMEAVAPAKQKDRQRALESAAMAIEKLDEALSHLDSAALGYWYGTLADEMARNGFQLSDSDGNVVSMLRNPLRAMVEGGEFRDTIRRLAMVSTKATRSAAESLPKHDHAGSSVELMNAVAIKRCCVEHGIEFVTTDTGFPALALRALLELAGHDVDRVAYWLKKAKDHQ
ncbi:MAG: hypothetical protein QM639_16020 [Rhodocyclaceae bacterium]